ncbi:hypothetical protein ECZU34_15540 [Escherichia coli]|nr:hypothetical protein ECZU34_15540 [Escherichia coli]GHL81716.1 hypothetical protein ECZU36_30000 [Escherichia coli]
MPRLLTKRGCWITLAAAPFLLFLAAWGADKLWPLPLHEVNPARVVVAQDGTPLWRFADAEGIWRYPVTIEDVSPRYLEALINYEDRWFWKHPGVNPFSVARAAWQDLASGRVISGGSTLTMQVARLLDPHPKTFGGKIRQLWRALQLEWHLSKREILTLYLNRAPFGGTLQDRCGKLGLSRKIACEFKLFRGGNAGGVAASAQPTTPGSLAGTCRSRA